MYFFFIFIFTFFPLIQSNSYPWSFQQRLRVPSAGSTYGLTPSYISGRGFMYMITGYDQYDPGVFIHSTDDGSLYTPIDLQHLDPLPKNPKWILKNKLKPSDAVPSDHFGKNLVVENFILAISAPNSNSNRGAVYIFNGTNEHYSETQKIISPDYYPNSYFGESMSLNNDFLFIGAKGYNSNSGAVYVFKKKNESPTFTFLLKLLPEDSLENQFFGEYVSHYNKVAVISARNDELEGNQSGSVYIFTQDDETHWTEKQKMWSEEIFTYRNNPNDWGKIDLSLGDRYFGNSLVITEYNDIIVGIDNLDYGTGIRDSVYIFSEISSNFWSLQQKLFHEEDSRELENPDAIPTEQNFFPLPDDQITSKTVIYSNQQELITNVYYNDYTKAFYFKSNGPGQWSFLSSFIAYNVESETNSYYDEATNTYQIRPSIRQFFNHRKVGGHILSTHGDQVQIRSQLTYGSCLIIYLTDHFNDGWSGAVLTIRSPDGRNDTFAPGCNPVDPFVVRYCPNNREGSMYTDDHTYILKVFAPTQVNFFWEISYRVMIEATGEFFLGDFSTTMHFKYSSATNTFKYVYGENLIFNDLKTVETTIDGVTTTTEVERLCHKCITIARANWEGLQIKNKFGFWPLTVYGSPYYISDFEGKNLYSQGKICYGDFSSNQCYQTLIDGLYRLRLGHGDIGNRLKYQVPLADSTWEGCGRKGTINEEFFFRILNGKCSPILIHPYSNKCEIPPEIDYEYFMNGGRPNFYNSPTFAPTFSPTISHSPSQEPTNLPTYTPTISPTQSPSFYPTSSPTQFPTITPPTEVPTIAPTEVPTELPTYAPTEVPTEVPTQQPTESPTLSRRKLQQEEKKPRIKYMKKMKKNKKNQQQNFNVNVNNFV